MVNQIQARQIMGRNFIGSMELEKIGGYFGSGLAVEPTPPIPYGVDCLKAGGDDHILILGVSANKNKENLNLIKMREIFGFDPKKYEPCFYNQDWYLKEQFANNHTLDPKWYLISKKVIDGTRAKSPADIVETLKSTESFPCAILATFTFFSYYLLNGEILWKHDFIWCSDKDANGDRIYVGRYADPKKINKNGFNIHRHLSLRQCYGFVPEIKCD